MSFNTFSQRIPSSFDIRSSLTIPADLLFPCPQAGTIIPFSYLRKKDKRSKIALIYLPFNYSSARSYPLFFLLHGGRGDKPEYWLGTQETPSKAKYLLDHLISSGTIPPVIAIMPTHYNEPSPELSRREELKLIETYPEELLDDLLPALRQQFHCSTLRADMAIAGFSLGAVITWKIFCHHLSEFYSFLPICGDCWEVAEMGGHSRSEETATHLQSCVYAQGYTARDFRLFIASGKQGTDFSNIVPQVNAMRRQAVFHFASPQAAGNTFCLLWEAGTHDYKSACVYLYNFLPQVFGC